MSKTKQKKILILHGPNLNLLGKREPHIYGNTSLNDVNQSLKTLATPHNVEVECFQSNHEGDLITKTQEVLDNPCEFIIINPAGFTHTSIAWRDALLAIKVPFIEVHLSNIFAREKFRHKSYFSDIAVAVVSGLGIHGYELALNYAIEHISNKE